MGERETLPRGGETDAGAQAPVSVFLSTSLLHLSALLVEVFNVTREDEVVIVELGELAVHALEALQLLG